MPLQLGIKNSFFAVLLFTVSGSFFVPVQGQDLIPDIVSPEEIMGESYVPSGQEKQALEQLTQFGKVFSFRLLEGKMEKEDALPLIGLLRKDPDSAVLGAVYLKGLQKSPFRKEAAEMFLSLAEEFPGSLPLNLYAGEFLLNNGEGARALAFLQNAFQSALSGKGKQAEEELRYSAVVKYTLSCFLQKKFPQLSLAVSRIDAEEELRNVPDIIGALLLAERGRLSHFQPLAATPAGFLDPEAERAVLELDKRVEKFFRFCRESDIFRIPELSLMIEPVCVAGRAEEFLTILHDSYLKKQDPSLLLVIADVYGTLNDAPTSFRYRMQALEQFPHPPFPMVMQVLQTLQNEKKFREALALLDKVLVKLQNHPLLLEEKAGILCELEDWQNALQTLALMPPFIERFSREALIYLELKQYPAGLRSAEKALDFVKQHNIKLPDNNLYLVYCVHAEKCGRVDLVDQKLSELLRENPKQGEILNFLGYTLADHGKDLPRAEKLIRDALALEPENYAYQDSLAWVLYRLGKFEEAKVWILKSLAGALNGAGEVQDHAGDIFHALKDYPNALKYWSLALESGVDEFRPEKTKEKIRKLKEEMRKK